MFLVLFELYQADLRRRVAAGPAGMICGRIISYLRREDLFSTCVNAKVSPCLPSTAVFTIGIDVVLQERA
jgi:hypothetical protein